MLERSLASVASEGDMAVTGALTPEIARQIREAGARNIRSARERAGLSVRELESRSGLSRSTLERLERAEAEPMLSTLFALAFGLGVPAADLLAGLPEPEGD